MGLAAGPRRGYPQAMIITERYLARSIASGLAAAAAVLLPLFAFLDLVSQLDDVGTGFFRAVDAFLCTALLVPRRLVQLAPFIALFGTVIALGRLAVTSELIAMRAAGLSPSRIGGLALKVGLLLVVMTALVDQFIAPPAQQFMITHRSEALAKSTELGSELGIWTRDARHFVRIGNPGVLRTPAEIEILRLDSGGLIEEYLYAERADIDSGNEWLLHGVTRKRFTADSIQTTFESEYSWKPFLDPGQIETLTRPVEALSPVELYRYARYLGETGQRADPYLLALWRKLGTGLMLVAMVLLAVPFVFGSIQTGLGFRLVLASVVGLGVFLLDQIIANAGLLLGISPLPLAVAPGLLLTLTAFALLRRAQ
jgi:lipopolysaccharide export system permease protein